MKRYIVEAKEPQNGERASSGGIRSDRGRIVSQYTNPIPYREPTPLAVPISKKQQVKEKWISSLLAEKSKDIVKEIISMLWDDFGRPFVNQKISQLKRLILSDREEPKKPQRCADYREEKSVMQPKENENEEMEDKQIVNNVIKFPFPRVG